VIDWGIGYGTTEGAGAPLGETMFLDGQAVSGTSPAAGNPRFLGPFAVGIAPDQKPAARYRSAPRMKSTSVADLLSDLAMTFEQPVLVVGTVHFDRLGTGTGLDNQSTARTLRNTEALFVAVV